MIQSLPNTATENVNYRTMFQLMETGKVELRYTNPTNNAKGWGEFNNGWEAWHWGLNRKLIGMVIISRR